MDIAISKKRAFDLKQYLIISILALLPLFFIVRYLWVLGQADFAVDRETLVVDEVKRGQFTVSVRGSGVLVPDNIQWLSANVDANVNKLMVKAGNIVKKGDLIVELSNPQLVQQLAEAQWELEAMGSELTASKVAQETALVAHKSNVLNAKLDYESSLLRYNAHKELVETGVVSKLDYQRARLETDQFKQRWKSSIEQLEKMEENLVAQNIARTARLNKTKKSVERIQQQVDSLYVKATMDSIVLDVPLETGQRIVMGANIAKLAQQNALIAELQVPEIQIRDVAVGQSVVIDTRNSKFEGSVSRVDPAVINGNVQVDVIFADALPDDARPDLSVDGEIKIAEIADALYVDRPLFAQSKTNSPIYKVSEDGQFAERVQVKIGYGSINEIQIIEGLKVGNKIVTSDPTRFENYPKFRIN